MIKIQFTIPAPKFIESIIVYFLLRYRKKHYGIAFQHIKLIKTFESGHDEAEKKYYGEFAYLNFPENSRQNAKTQRINSEKLKIALF